MGWKFTSAENKNHAVLTLQFRRTVWSYNCHFYVFELLASVTTVVMLVIIHIHWKQTFISQLIYVSFFYLSFLAVFAAYLFFLLLTISRLLITFYTCFYLHHPMHPNTTVLDNAHIHCSCRHIPLTSLTVILLHAWCVKTVISTSHSISSVLFIYMTVLACVLSCHLINENDDDDVVVVVSA